MFRRKKNKMKLAELAEDFILSVKVSSSSARTPSNYRWRLKLFLERYGNLPPKELKKPHLQRFKSDLDDSGRYAETSIDAMVQAIKAFCNWLHTEGYIDKPISDAIHRNMHSDRPNAGPISPETLQTVLARCQTLRETALIKFLADTGARRGEVVSARISRMDFEKRTALVYGKVGKRLITYIEPTRAAVLDYIHNERPDVAHDYLFCNDRRPYGRMLGDAMYRLVKRLGANLDDDFTHPHAYRHLVANEYAHGKGGGLDLAQKKLGHKSIQTTLYYVHTDMSYLQSRDGDLSVLNLLE